jgi:predicted membrane-bound spermidine synthase
MDECKQAGLLGLFFSSGVVALCYQVAWQRMIYALFGVDMESVTIIVSVFMFGLGIGAIVGGRIADFSSRSLVHVFAALEFSIGVAGLASPWLIDWLARWLADGSRALTVVASFALLGVPTICMGATLPVLVAHINKRERHIGSSVGALYFANTLGASFGAWLAGFVLLAEVGLRATVWLAGIGNFVVAATTLLAFGRRHASAEDASKRNRSA